MTDPGGADPSDRVCVGVLAGAFGVHGEVRVKSFCAEPGAIARYGTLFSSDGARQFSLRITRAIPDGFAARLSGITDRDTADTLRGVQLFADRSRLPHLPDDEFYHADLIGLAVHDTGGVLLGTVLAVHNHGAGDILEVFSPGRKSAMLLPFTKAVVPTVDLTLRRIVADPPREDDEPEPPESPGGSGPETRPPRRPEET